MAGAVTNVSTGDHRSPPTAKLSGGRPVASSRLLMRSTLLWLPSWPGPRWRNQLADLVIQYRVGHGLTQADLARLLGGKQPAVARLESGDHEPTLATLTRLSRSLRISLRLDRVPRPWCSSPPNPHRTSAVPTLEGAPSHAVAAHMSTVGSTVTASAAS